MSDHFPQDATADRRVRRLVVAPPPAVALHRLRGRHEALRHRVEVRLRIVEAEDQAPGADPTERQTFGAQIVLEHPVVARRPGVEHRPDGGQIGDPHRQPLLREALVERFDAAVPHLVEIAVKRADLRRAEPAQELVHRRHHIGVGIEGAAREADVERTIVAKPPHQVLAAANHAHGKSAAQRLPIGDHVGLDAEILLRTAGGETEADKDLVENQDDLPLGADGAQPLQPVGIRRAVEMRSAPAIDQGGIGGRIRVRMKGLKRIDQHAGDVAATPQHAQRILRHVLERVSLMRGRGVAETRLHVAPPAVIGSAEAHEVRSARMIAREPHGLHDRLGAGHMKRHRIEPGHLPQPFDIVGDHRVIGAEHRAERGDPMPAPLQAVLVEIVSEQVHAIGAGEVVGGVAVEIRDGQAGGRLNECPEFEVAAHEAAVLEGHAIGLGELQVGDSLSRLRREPQRLRSALPENSREPEESGAARSGDRFRRAVRAEDMRLVVFIEWNERGDPPRHSRMSRERPVLRPRQLQARFQPGQHDRQNGRAERVKRDSHGKRIHRLQPYPARFTER